MHTIQKRAVVVNDQVVIRPMMYLALTYDHRIVDGREAVSFLVRIKESRRPGAACCSSCNGQLWRPRERRASSGQIAPATRLATSPPDLTPPEHSAPPSAKHQDRPIGDRSALGS